MATQAERIAAARRMRSFYEPAHFGGQPSTYSATFQQILSEFPTTMGGFQYQRPLEDGEPPPGGGIPELPGAYGLRQAYDMPPLGRANLAQYGKGQIGRYGKGALAAYAPLAREDALRWRSR